MSYHIQPRSMREDYQVIHENSYVERAKLNGYGSSHEKHQTLDQLAGGEGNMAAAFGQTHTGEATPNNQINDQVDVNQDPTQDGTDQNGGSVGNSALEDIVYRLMQNPQDSSKEIHDNVEFLSDQVRDLTATDHAGNNQHAGIQRNLQRGFDSFNKKVPTYQAFLKNLEENKQNIEEQLKQAEEKLNPEDDDQQDKNNGLQARKTSPVAQQDDEKKKGRTENEIEDSDVSDKEKEKLEGKIQSLKDESSEYQSVIDNVKAELQRAKDLQTHAKNHMEHLQAGTTTQQQASGTNTTDQDGNNGEHTGDQTGDGKNTGDQQHTASGKVRGPQDEITDPYEIYKKAHPEVFGGTATETTTDPTDDALKNYLARRQHAKEQSSGGSTSSSEEQTKALISQILAGAGQSGTDTALGLGSLNGLSGLSGTTGTSSTETSTEDRIQSILQQFQN